MRKAASKEKRKDPPKKQPGTCKGPRRIDGSIFDVSTCALRLGISEKTVRSKVRRGLLPFRKYSGRIIFLEREIQECLAGLPGVTVAEALRNLAARRGRQG